MNRKTIIKKYCTDQKVLDLGCKGSWQELSSLHKYLNNISDVTGVDIEPCLANKFILDNVMTLTKVKNKYNVNYFVKIKTGVYMKGNWLKAFLKKT